MSPLRALLALVAFSPVASFAVVGTNDVYQESGGIVVMEAERTPSSLGTGTDRWETHTPGGTNYVDGATNEAHIEFQGNSSNGGTPKTPLTYKFRINQGGYYQIHLRARARLDGAEPDKNNDCYVKVGGDSFGAGPNPGNTHMNDAPLSLLTSDTKMYGGSPTTWGWANLLDAGGDTNKRVPIYNFTAGGEYTLTISGRSIKYNIDRIIFRHVSVDEGTAKSATLAESSIGGTSANAGSDKSLTLPSNSIVLNGSGSTSTGSITGYSWTQVSGPSTATLSGAASANLTASALVQGAYIFRLTVTTSGGETATDDAIVNVAAAGGSGQAVATLMLINADTDSDIGPITSGMTINLAETGANLNIRADTSPSTVGSVRFNYDGDANYMVQSGKPYTIGGDTLTDYWAWTPSVGTHTLTATPYTLSAGGGTAGTPLTVVFTVVNSTVTGNPVANAGTDKSITLPTSSVVLNGSGTDTGGSISSYGWTQVSGPSTASLSGAASANLTASALVQGSYVFRLTVTDNSGLTATDDATVTVAAAVGGNPVANAGTDKSITLPTSSVVLNGSGTDTGGSITSHAWTQVSGPSTASLSGAASANLTASALVQGTYIFRLTVTDNSGLTASDEASVFVLPASSGSGVVSGELKKWHKVTLSFAGPATSESATPNPFTDYRLNVTFTHPATGKSYVVPGYYAADGNAANTSATSGNVWRAHFAPDETGPWTYTASFRTGTNVAASTSATAGTGAGHFDGDSGNFTIAATDKTGPDFRGKGRLDYVGKHHLRFAETGEYFMKAGVDAPENLLAFADFDGDFKSDGTEDSRVKTWSAHVADWQSGDPVWQGTKGKGLIGAINYLASEGLNAFSFLTMNINGDDKNVFPYTSYGERVRLDVSRLEQWEIIFEHGTRKGMHLHFKTQEIENQNLLDGGDLGNQRILYYRELIARFGHHPALNWNLGEECTATTTRKKAWAQYFHDTDPYKHPIVIHNTTSVLHKELLGSASKLTGFSLQLNASDFTDMFSMTKDYIDDSAATGRPWVVACDEPGDSQYSLRPDSDPGSSHVNARKNALWGNIMAGGAGVEWYFGYALAHSDLTCQDFRSRNSFWDFCRHALQFLDANDVPFQDMTNQNSLVSGNGNNANRCLAKTGDSYLVQLHSGGSHTLNLAAASGQFTVKWLNPRTGVVTTRPSVTGGGTVSLGSPPDTTTEDWVVFLSSSTGGGPVNAAPQVNAGPDKSATLSGASVQVALSGSVTDDGLPLAVSLTHSWSLVSGPAPVSFSPGNAPATNASFTAAGTYTLRLSSSDTQFAVSDDVRVVVSAPATSGNNPPVFSGFSTTIAANQSIFISYALILNGSSDPDGDPLSILAADGSSNAGGTVTMAADHLVYTAPAGFNGPDSFPLTVQDGRGGSTTAPLQIQVGTVTTGDGITGKPAPTLQRLTGNQLRIRFTGTPGLAYTFQRSGNLVSWTNLATIVAGGDGAVEYTDPNPPSGNAFYRLSAP